MCRFAASRDADAAEHALRALIVPRLAPSLFADRIRRLQAMYSACTDNCSPPYAGPGLQITSEINYQCEMWLPLTELRRHFYQFYRQALTYSPVLSSTPFASLPSWAAISAGFPDFLRQFTNPARLLHRITIDADLRTRFLFWSFMPERFYGAGSDRYPEQAAVIAAWLHRRSPQCVPLRCLDAASGDGAAGYGLVRLLCEQGWHPERFAVEGWTLDPLEVWSAAYGRFPHNPGHESRFGAVTAPVFEQGADRSLVFRAVDLTALADTETSDQSGRFDLIVCNGLLGGPILNRQDDLRNVVSALRRLLAPGGMLLAADHFHGGWKKKLPGELLRELFRANGLSVADAGEGLAGLAPVRFPMPG